MGKIPAHAKQYAMTALGKFLESSRSGKDMNQKDLGDVLGITQQQVSYMEGKPESITIARMYDINMALSLDMIQLLKAFGFTLPAIRDYFREYFKDHK